MNPYIILALSVFALTACAKTDYGLIFGKPFYEKRDIEVTDVDLQILERASELLVSSDKWSRNTDRTCSDVAGYSLFCALEVATVEIIGEYVHRQPALQQVRFAIDDEYRGHWSKHRLADFNGYSKTTFTDIQRVLELAKQRTQRKLDEYGRN